jgi:hypothetical protein
LAFIKLFTGSLQFSSVLQGKQLYILQKKMAAEKIRIILEGLTDSGEIVYSGS